MTNLPFLLLFTLTHMFSSLLSISLSIFRVGVPQLSLLLTCFFVTIIRLVFLSIDRASSPLLLLYIWWDSWFLLWTLLFSHSWIHRQVSRPVLRVWANISPSNGTRTTYIRDAALEDLRLGPGSCIFNMQRVQFDKQWSLGTPSNKV